jgi:pyruvate/2-oxoglutarate dehydrogenase complex dihydrolipoamide acyltransferase (E2) component
MIRTLTPEEWFTDYQLRAIARAHTHVPIDLEVDVTRLVRAYAEAGRRAPLTAIVVKSAAMLAARHPEVNRAVLRTPVGTRLVQFEDVNVNFPLVLRDAGQEVLSATVLRHANVSSIERIVADIEKARSRTIASLPIARRLARDKCTIFDRAVLRARHFLAYSVPSVYAKYAGGISVSSLVRRAPPGVTLRVPSYGPTAFTICPGALRTTARHSILHVGIGYDHAALAGRHAVRFAEELASSLVGGDGAIFGPPRTTGHGSKQ